MGSRRSTHSCWEFLFVRDNVSHTYYAFINDDVISLRTEYCGVCLGVCISWWLEQTEVLAILLLQIYVGANYLDFNVHLN